MITAVVLTKNEEKNIGQCLDHLQWCDEIIVIDDYSTDKTVAIAKSRGARVFKRRLKGNFTQQRNLALKKARFDWVLFVDADEVVSPALSREIVRRVKEGNYDGFLISRQEVLLNKPLRCADKPINDWSCGSIKLLRLARKSKGYWRGKVHERWVVSGKIGVLKNQIFHYAFPDLTTALKKINFYSSIRAEELSRQGARTSWWQIIFYPLGKFLKNYFWHKGFLDGTAGLIFCLLMSLHSFLVRAKLWQKARADR